VELSITSPFREDILLSIFIPCSNMLTCNVPYPLRSHRVNQLDSFMDCEELNRFGRFSFNNYNKEVEVAL